MSGLKRLAAACVAFAGAAQAQPWHGLSAEELAETFPPERIVTGAPANRDACARTKFAVWVEHRHGVECIRYFPSRNVEGAARAVFFFHGDRILVGRNPRPTGVSPKDSAGTKLKEAHALSSINGVPFVLVSRPGVYGSSGAHGETRRPKEYYSLNAAVDAIKARHGIGEVILSGQSGGATAVGALLTLGRTDVACAVGTSGAYDIVGRNARIGRYGCDTTGYCDAYNVIDFVPGVVQNPARRIFIVGDPKDERTPFDFQRAFAEKLHAAGHGVMLVEAKGGGPDHHALAHIATRASGWCNAGLPSEEIVAKIRAGELGLYDARRK